MALSAIRDALDRAGLIAPRTLDVAVGPKPWETVFDIIASSSRSESRRRRGVPGGEPPTVEPALSTARDGADDCAEIIDAEPAEPVMLRGRKTPVQSRYE